MHYSRIRRRSGAPLESSAPVRPTALVSRAGRFRLAAPVDRPRRVNRRAPDTGIRYRMARRDGTLLGGLTSDELTVHQVPEPDCPNGQLPSHFKHAKDFCVDQNRSNAGTKAY